MAEKIHACLRAVLYVGIGLIVMHALGGGSHTDPTAESKRSEHASVSSVSTFPAEKFPPNPFLTKKSSSELSHKERSSSPEAAWVLRGTITANEGKNRAVVEEAATGRQRWVLEGGSLGSTQVAQIKRESALVAGDSEVQWLTFQPRKEILQRKSLNRDSAFGSSEIQVEQIGFHEFVVKQELLKKLAQHLPKMLDSLGFMLIEIDTGKLGLLIDGEESGMELFRGMGIEDGDALLSINGKPMQSGEDLLAVFKDLPQQQEIRLEIERDEEVKVLTYFVRP